MNPSPETPDQHLSEAMLLALYQAFDHLAQEFDWACAEGCAACCSDRLLLTSLEARLVARALEQAGRADLLARALQADGPPAPPLSTNGLARLCLSHQEPPAQPDTWAASGPCPLLQGQRCPIYQARPLACRSMASLRKCQAGGQALADSWWLTLGTVFMQLVEAVDPEGVYGPLGLVLAHLRQPGSQPALAACQSLPGLLAPSQHQARLTAALDQVFAQPVMGQPLGHLLQRLRQ